MGKQPPLPEHRCTAKSRTSGQQCRKKAIPGGTVCRYHGGAAPQVKRRAQLRLLELVDPAIVTLAKVMANGENDQVRLAAAKDILDRAGVPRQSEATVRVEDARELLLLKLQELDN